MSAAVTRVRGKRTLCFQGRCRIFGMLPASTRSRVELFALDNSCRSEVENMCQRTSDSRAVEQRRRFAGTGRSGRFSPQPKTLLGDGQTECL